MKDFNDISADIKSKMRAVKRIQRQVPIFVAGAAEAMKDANFSAQGFVTNGRASRWQKRRKETQRTEGKRILHSTGTLQNSVQVEAIKNRIHVGVDLNTVPYAQVHNEGGRITQNVRPHHRKHYKSGKRFQVRSFTRHITMPQRKYLGHSPDIMKKVSRELDYQLNKLFK
ncbi:MAG: phage virion morphogenesis protein [Marinifilaceae bacterium]